MIDSDPRNGVSTAAALPVHHFVSETGGDGGR